MVVAAHLGQLRAQVERLTVDPGDILLKGVPGRLSVIGSYHFMSKAQGRPAMSWVPG
jgi:hypothetical protein